MRWIEFTEDHDFTPAASAPFGPTTAFKAGQRLEVTQECAEQVIALGRGGETAAPETAVRRSRQAR